MTEAEQINDDLVLVSQEMLSKLIRVSHAACNLLGVFEDLKTVKGRQGHFIITCGSHLAKGLILGAFTELSDSLQ